MIFRKFLIASALSAAALLPLAPASAQTALSVGATVTDPQGGEVGTITSIEGDVVVVRTDRHEARLAAASFATAEDRVLISLTRDQLNSQMDQLAAQAAQAFRVGATVHDRDGAVVGPVEALDAESVTIRMGETQFRLPRSGVAPGANGLVIGSTRAEGEAWLEAPSSNASN